MSEGSERIEYMPKADSRIEYPLRQVFVMGECPNYGGRGLIWISPTLLVGSCGIDP